jgi:hypothetical protein
MEREYRHAARRRQIPNMHPAYAFQAWGETGAVEIFKNCSCPWTYLLEKTANLI